MRALSTGTVTFLFTDIEGSTKLWEQHSDLMRVAFQQQEAMIRQAIAEHDGIAYKMVGDAFQAAFQTAPAAVAAAVASQRSLAAATWGDLGPLRVRMALHSGVVEDRGDDYVGPLLNRVARLMAAGHGGQILLTAATRELARDYLPPGVDLRDLGLHHLKDLSRPERIYQAVIAGLPSDFPPLRITDERPASPSPPSTSVRVMVVDDQRLMRDGLASLLDIQPGITVVGTATNGQEAIEQARRLQPDVALMDVRMPVLDGVSATAELKRELPSCQVLMLTTFDDEEYVLAALRVGACGYLLKDIPAPDLAQAIHSAHNGIYQLNAAIAAKVVASLKAPVPPPSSPMPVDLSDRELDVLRLIARGMSDKEVAEALIISHRTVQRHLGSIYGKLGVTTRHAATRFAIDHGLV